MKIAIIGYGKMGKEIEAMAISRGHSISVIIDKDNGQVIDLAALKNADVAIEFTQPDSSVENYLTCFEIGIPVVSGTTGWLNRWDELINRCNELKGTFFYASNFSLGVNILFQLNKQLGLIMNGFPDYEITIEETHHTQKLDAPSGTAIALANDLIKVLDSKKKWKLDKSNNSEELRIIAHRIENVPGDHTIKYESSVDSLELKHSAKSRKGFALGAIIAAEFVKDKKGIYSMSDLLKF